MVRNDDLFAVTCITPLLMASRLARQAESVALQYRDHLIRGEARDPRSPNRYLK